MKRLIFAAVLIFILITMAGEFSRSIAMPVWVEGEIVSLFKKEKHKYIQLEEKIYTLMPSATIGIRYKTYSGAVMEKVGQFRDLKKGQKIMMRVEGYRVYQILVFK